MAAKQKPQKAQALGSAAVVLTVDTLLALVERVAKLERRCDTMETTAQENFDCVIEYVPRIQKDGSVIVKAFTDDEPRDVVIREAT